MSRAKPGFGGENASGTKMAFLFVPFSLKRGTPNYNRNPIARPLSPQEQTGKPTLTGLRNKTDGGHIRPLPRGRANHLGRDGRRKDVSRLEFLR